MHLSIKGEFLAGTDIETAVKEAAEFAKKLGVVYVMFNFNGVSMSIGANADIKKAVNDYHEASAKVCKQFVVSR